ncbi:hypothetical protein GCM10009845_31380 [Pedococcus bigeumensis]
MAVVAVVALSVPTTSARAGGEAVGEAVTDAPTAASSQLRPDLPIRLPWAGPARPTPRTGTGQLASTSSPRQARRVCVRVANVRSGPGLSHRVMTTLKQGTMVRGTTTRGWLRIRATRWISVSVTCRSTGGAKAVRAGETTFTAWVRALDPAGNARWTMDHARRHTRGDVRGLTVFHSSGPARSTVYIQPGMTWSKTKLVMAHEAIHVRQIRYGGFSHSIVAFGSVRGMERAADCGATIILGRVVRAGCPAAMAPRVRHLLAGHPA